MRNSKERFENLMGLDLRARHKYEREQMDQSFENLIIHKEIHGDKVYVLLNLERVWNQIR
ncbi:hypothetical protein [Neobacillus mesonae]|uniref:hypothetical protein n=1 Tax=Neobacillus mesonae TaxID=1193713 RepID=UPI00203DFD77|nr:hypothetical protein [Neobacillus mesonae]MCM3570926.1 hypothetical protein [Neobacillus mesonae]